MKTSSLSFVALLAGVSLSLAATSACAAADEVALAGLGGGVKVTFDQHDIPHIYAKSWPDAARVFGNLHAGERLWQMDLFRRQGSGTVAEILGPGGSNRTSSSGNWASGAVAKPLGTPTKCPRNCAPS